MQEKGCLHEIYSERQKESKSVFGILTTTKSNNLYDNFNIGERKRMPLWNFGFTPFLNTWKMGLKIDFRRETAKRSFLVAPTKFLQKWPNFQKENIDVIPNFIVLFQYGTRGTFLSKVFKNECNKTTKSGTKGPKKETKVPKKASFVFFFLSFVPYYCKKVCS